MADPQGAAPLGSTAWIEAALRERLGPDAALGTLAFEARTLRIRGARLPFGAAALQVEEAEIELGAGLPLGPLPLAARLVSLRGALAVGAVTIPIELVAGDPEAPAWFDGAMRATIAGVLTAPIDLAVSLDVAPHGIDVSDGRVTVGALVAALTGTVARDEDSGHVIADLALTTDGHDGGRPPKPPGPAGSRIALHLDLDPGGSIHASRLTGRVALADARSLVTLPGGLVPGPESVVDLDLDVLGALADPTLRGRVYAAPLVIARGSREGACRFDDVTAVIDLDRRRLRYRDLQASAYGARVAGWGRVPFAPGPPGADAVPLAAVALKDAGVGFLAALASLAGVPLRAARAASATFGFHVPSDLAIDGELMLRLDRSATGTLAVVTPRSQLRFHVTLAGDGALVGSTLRGLLAAEDAATIGLFPGAIRARPPAAFELDAGLGGSLAAPGITGRVHTERVILDVSADPAHPSLLIEDASVFLDVTRERLAWHRLAGRFYGGTFASSGRVDFGSAAALSATVGFQGVRVEQLPTQASGHDGGDPHTPGPAGESRLAALIQGAASGEVRFERHGFDEAPLTAHGEIRVAEPRYLFARALAEPLARYGLPRIRSTGRGPLVARVCLEQREILVDAVQAAVEGVEVAGDVRLALDGRLGGRLVVHLLAAYLSQSPILALPAAVAGRVTIPVDLGGTAAAPEIHTDALAILEGLMSKNRVGDALKGVLDDILGGASPRGRAGRRSKRG